MSFGISAGMWALIGVSAASAVSQGVAAEKAEDTQYGAMQDAKKQAQAQLKQADEATNAANMKSPDTGAMLSSAMLSGRAGQSGTMLTGPQGVSKDKLNLQRNTLLGQ